jgi:hypothetical protein
MSTLPDRTVFGNAPSGLSGRPGVDYTGAVAPGRQNIETASRSGEGMKALGAGLSHVANAAVTFAGEENRKQERLDGAMADATSTIYEDNVKNAIANETDPAKIKEILDGLDTGYQNAGANLSGEQAQLFGMKAQHRANGIRLGAEKRIFDLNRTGYMDAANETLGNLRQAYATGDKQTQADALENAGKIFDYMAENRYIAPDAAEQNKNLFARQSSAAFIMNQPVDKQFELLGVTPANVNEAVGKGAAFFQSKGWAPHQAAAIMGHLLHESGGKLDPNARAPGDGRDGSDSIGIGQWNSGRAKQLKAFAAAAGKPWNDLGVQLAFVQHELETTEGGAADALRGAKDIDSAVAAGLKYERPKGFEGGISTASGGRQRLAYGKRILGQIGQGDAFNDNSSEGAYEIASSSNGHAGALDPEDHAKLVQHAFAQKQKELSLAAQQDKQAVENATSQYYLRLTDNKVDNLLEDIQADPVLRQHPKEQLQMMDAAQHHINALNKNKGGEFGDAYYEASQKIMGGEITSPRALYELAGQGKLSPHGVDRLKTMLKDLNDTPDKAGITAAKTHALKAAKDYLSFDDPDKFMKDPEGERIFNLQFVPQFEKQFNDWVKAGKDPYEFIQSRVKPMYEGMRDRDAINRARLSAIDGVAGVAETQKNNPDAALPPPTGVKLDQQKWSEVVGVRPNSPSGAPVAASQWSAAVRALAASPDKKNRDFFNKVFPSVKAEDILSKLGVPFQ